jgi:hypothetical protein
VLRRHATSAKVNRLLSIDLRRNNSAADLTHWSD